MPTYRPSFTLLVVLVVSTLPAFAQFSVLHNFSGPDGASPTGLIQDGAFFYGAGANGGDTTNCSPDGCGVIFKSDTSGKITLLHIFHATDGYVPTGLVKGSDGNFYGTTMAGGHPSGGGPGTIFRIDGSGNFQTLYAFTGGFACCDGAAPTGQLIQADDGNIYGTTAGGGAFRDIHHQGGFGTVFRFDPADATVTILHSFNFDGDGFYPNGPLVQGTDGFLYGTTTEGSGPNRDGPGTAFRIDSSGNFKVVAVLAGQPQAGLIQGSDGNLYGTNQGLGGSVFRVDTNGNFAFVNKFEGGDGYNPHFRVTQGSDSFLYGTAPQGGLLDFQGGDIFRLSLGGTLTVLHSFTTTGSEGFSPNSQLIQGADGALYGTTGIGGPNRRGAIFRFDQRVPGPIASVSVNPAIVIAGQTSKGLVTLTSPAPPGGLVVMLSAQTGQIVIPAKITVREGFKKKAFRIKTLNIGASVTLHIYASSGGQGARTSITVTP